eukprot:bmy_16574T0
MCAMSEECAGCQSLEIIANQALESVSIYGSYYTAP